MTTSLQSAFNQSLEALERGESLDQVLGRYPELTNELRPLLLVAKGAMDVSEDQPSREAELRSRSAMLSRANQLKASPGRRLSFSLVRWRLAAALVALSLIVASGFGLVAVSAQALPGDDLYTVKRTAERIQLSLTTGVNNRLSLTIYQETRRLHEVQRLLALGRVVEVEFEAKLDSKSGSLWQFGNVPVLVTESTIVPDGLRVGDVMLVRGRTTTQGWVKAHSFSAAGLTFDGRIESAESNQWVIAGRGVTILPSSFLDPNLQPGDLVRVIAHTEGEILVAQQISAIEPEATPVPTIAPPNPDPSTTPAPTATNNINDDEDDDLEQFDRIGELEAKQASRWQIGGQWIYLEQSTDLDGSFPIGATVRAKGEILPDGRYLAEEIRQLEDADDDFDEEGVEETAAADDEEEDEEDDDDNDTSDETVEVDIEGVIQSIGPGQWVVDGQTVIITSETRIEDSLAVGDQAHVDARRSKDGRLYAEKIEAKD